MRMAAEGIFLDLLLRFPWLSSSRGMMGRRSS